MIEEIMNFYKINNYYYNVVNKTLVIKETLPVEYFKDIKLELKKKRYKVDNIIVGR